MCGMTKMVMKQKIQSFSLVVPWIKAMFICQFNLANVGPTNFKCSQQEQMVVY
jgi:hypothetical protein